MIEVIVETLKRIEERLASLEDLLEDINVQISDRSLPFGSGFEEDLDDDDLLIEEIV